MLDPKILQEDIDTFQKDGVILVKGLFANYVELIREGIEKNLASPGPFAAENLRPGETGRFFDDYCNWQRISEFKEAITSSPVGFIASQLMKSSKVQLFHDHVLIKEPGTSKPTPWHQDSPYYFIEGNQTISFWSPMDKVTNASLRCVAGSHKWRKAVLPKKWLNNDNFYSFQQDFIPVPDPDSDKNMEIKEFPMDPGDAVAFDFRILHGARGNTSITRRRAFSLRLVGDDARFKERGEKTSPPFPNHGMISGQPLRQDWFPVIYPN
mgnify:FL=1